MKAGTIGTLVLVFACFSFSSAGYLAWLYHLITLVPPSSVDALTMGAGYAFQGLGIALTCLSLHAHREFLNRATFITLVALHFACAVPAALGETLAVTLAFGYTMNLLCGAIATFYLICLAKLVAEGRRGIVFGGGYGLSIVFSWVLSLVGSSFAEMPTDLIWCAVFSVLAAFIAMAVPFHTALESPDGYDGEKSSPAQNAPSTGSRGADDVQKNPVHSIVALACITVLLISIIKNMGFNFPTADIGAEVDLAFSRLFYAFGLVVAGIVIDRNRKLGAIMCMAALAIPFVLISLVNEPLPSMVFWVIDYFFYGFFSVFRIVLFADLANRENRWYLAGFGLMIGRLGDALGTVISLSVAGSAIALVSVAAVLFAAVVFVFYQLFQQLYMVQPVRERTQDEVFDDFSTSYELSPREREVLRQVLENQTNAEIAATLFVSESTVKFHMRNLLKKTDCKNRTDLLKKYSKERSLT